ncbi:hypothetical protein ACFL1R_03645 [Candidatus Latescibacterota bacterium]
MIVDKINEQLRFFNSKFENIKWVLGTHISYAVLISRPDIIEFSKLPNDLFIDNVRVNTSDVFGATLPPNDRQIIVNETLASARRILLADSFDQLVESFCRSYAILTNNDHLDPYQTNDNIYFVGSKLYKGTKEATYFDDKEKAFIKEVINPIRNAIRHNNAILPPPNDIDFSGELFDNKIEIRIKVGNMIKADLNICNHVFNIIRKIGNNAFSKIIIAAKKLEAEA